MPRGIPAPQEQRHIDRVRGARPARSMALWVRKKVPNGTSTASAARIPARSMALWVRKGTAATLHPPSLPAS
jgi:hypothetical protein